MARKLREYGTHSLDKLQLKIYSVLAAQIPQGSPRDIYLVAERYAAAAASRHATKYGRYWGLWSAFKVWVSTAPKYRELFVRGADKALYRSALFKANKHLEQGVPVSIVKEILRARRFDEHIINAVMDFLRPDSSA